MSGTTNTSRHYRDLVGEIGGCLNRLRAQNDDHMRNRTLDSWVFRRFPNASPLEVAREADRSDSVDLEEYQRAVWLWQRRPSDITILVHLLIFGIGALIHIPLILADDFVLFAVYHAFYLCLVAICVGRFLWLESRYRRWKQDYLRSLSRLSNESDCGD